MLGLIAYKSSICGSHFRTFIFSETLPFPMWSLRTSPLDDSRQLSEFQEELVLLASQLIGDSTFFENTSMTVLEANSFVENAVELFMEAGQMQLEFGLDEFSLVDVKAASVKRKKQGCTTFMRICFFLLHQFKSANAIHTY